MKYIKTNNTLVELLHIMIQLLVINNSFINHKLTDIILNANIYAVQ
jgi:hypothetical protein